MKLHQTALFTGIAAALLLSSVAFVANAQGTNGQEPPAQSAQQAASVKAKKPVMSPVGQTAEKTQNLQAVVVTGIRASQERSIQLKRDAPNIEDSISAVNIGQLPDVSITDSLQRLTGVQINRSAGEGTSVSVHGLPEVETTLNGMPFITADNIDSIQPNYGTLPASLFSGVDVFKSPTASMLDSGISGTINLRTHKPFDFKSGWSAFGSAKMSRGSVTKKNKPDTSLALNYNAAHWGVLVSASFSDLSRNGSSDSSSPGGLAGENSSDANNSNNQGFLTAWPAAGLPVPSSITRLPDGSVDVNGLRNGAFLVGGDGTAAVTESTVEKNRKGLQLAFEADLGSGFLLNVNGFYTHEQDENYNLQGVPEGINHNVATTIPLKYSDTGVLLTNPNAVPGTQVGDWHQELYSLQKYNYYIGGFRSTTNVNRTISQAKNFTANLTYDDGGPFTGSLSLADNSATQGVDGGEIQFVQDDGSSWGNHLAPGVSFPNTMYPGPPSQGGNHLFNPGGLAPGAEIVTVNNGGGSMLSLSPNLASRIVDPNTYVSKGFDGSGSAQRASNHYIHLDGAYQISDNWALKFGGSNSVRSAHSRSWADETMIYAGEGASDPNGCAVRWVYDDQILDGGGVPGSCTAGNASGYFHGNPIGNQRLTEYPSIVSNNLTQVTIQGSGITMLGLNPHAMSSPSAFFDALGYPMQRNMNPTGGWNVSLHAAKAFGEATFSGDAGGHDFSGNFGLRAVRTNLNVTQFLSGPPAPYGLYGPSAGAVPTNRSYTDWLPAVNFQFSLTPSLIWRFAASKDMMPLTLDQWGGGLSLGYNAVAITLPNKQTVVPVASASESGDPNLDPWRATNFGSSLEYYINSSSMVSLAVFDMRIKSFIESSGSVDCNLPDSDGVVRGRCVPFNILAQGTGANLKGAEADYKQGLTFLPGLLANTGFEINATYSPSSTGEKDLSGADIPFPDNSEKSGNFIVWYQDSNWKARVALNYRSKEAVSSNFLGIQGLEEYEMPQTYVDASVSYRVNPHFEVFVQGQNLTNEKQKNYLTWPDMFLSRTYSERYFMVGVRGNF